MRIIGFMVLVVVILGGGVVYEGWDCVSGCMLRGGLYEECVKQCGG